MVKNHVAMIEALRRYTGLLKQEEIRLNGIKKSHRSNDFDRENAESKLREAATKITDAENELSVLQSRM